MNTLPKSREPIKRDYQPLQNRVSLPPFSKPTDLGLRYALFVPPFSHGSTTDGTNEGNTSWGSGKTPTNRRPLTLLQSPNRRVVGHSSYFYDLSIKRAWNCQRLGVQRSFGVSLNPVKALSLENVDEMGPDGSLISFGNADGILPLGGSGSIGHGRIIS